MQQSAEASSSLNPNACCATGPYFSSVAVSGWGVVVDYRPRRVDLGALRSGALTEVRLKTGSCHAVQHRTAGVCKQSGGAMPRLRDVQEQCCWRCTVMHDSVEFRAVSESASSANIPVNNVQLQHAPCAW
jgi:hypothetical protein